MELILISQDNLKVMLSENDLQKYNIESDELDYSKLLTRNILKSILNEAKTLTGFDTEGQRYFIQVFTSPHGGCELFITKGEEENFMTETEKTTPQKVVRSYSSLYSFDSFPTLVRACRRLYESGCVADAVTYRDICGKYYLSLSHKTLSPYTRLDKFTFLQEYGKRETGDSFNMYIEEYGTLICKNSIEILGVL